MPAHDSFHCLLVVCLSSFVRVRPGHSPDSRWRCPRRWPSGSLRSPGVIVPVRPAQGSASQAATARRCRGSSKPRRRPACFRRESDTKNGLGKRCLRGTARRPTEAKCGLVSRWPDERAAMRGNSEPLYYWVRCVGERRETEQICRKGNETGFLLNQGKTDCIPNK